MRQKIFGETDVIVKRNYYLNQLISKRENGLIKVITGIRRSGKSFLLFELYYQYLLNSGVKEKQILKLPLDEAANARYRNPLELDQYIRNFISKTKKECYVFIDEIQFVQDIDNPWIKDGNDKIGFVDVLLGLMKLKNADIYVTGSNSKMLSTDIVTQFRDKGDEIKVYPFAYSEYCRAMKDESEKTWREYYTYGGMPRIISMSDRKSKTDYLTNLFENTYLKDVLERNDIRSDKGVLDRLIRIIASSVGSLSNPKKISDTFKTELGISINSFTIEKYLDYFVESFLINRSFRYDVKGRKYINTPLKYYFTDVGIRNAVLDFRQQEENHIMENIIYNELLIRGYSVDVGMVEFRHRNADGKDIRSQLEVDFIAKTSNKQLYIQSALNIDSEEKRLQETNSLNRIPDSFKKLVVIKESIEPWTDQNGINYIGVREFISGQYDDMVYI